MGVLREETKIAVFPGGSQLTITDVVECRWDDDRGCLVFDRKDGSKIYVKKESVVYEGRPA